VVLGSVLASASGGCGCGLLTPVSSTENRKRQIPDVLLTVIFAPQIRVFLCSLLF
jgi:hypothetical protein